MDCTSLTEIQLPEGLEILGMAFGGTGIVSITIPNSVTDCNLGDMPMLKTVHFGENVKTLALSGSGIEVFEIPSSITEIRIEAFKNCASLREIIIPTSVTTIRKHAFQDCTAHVSCANKTNLHAILSIQKHGGQIVRR